jgi:hypothetical protein
MDRCRATETEDEQAEESIPRLECEKPPQGL